MQYFKTAALRYKAKSSGLVVEASTCLIKKKKPIIRKLTCYGLSALRLCVWLFDNERILFFYANQGFLLILRTIERKIFQFGIATNLDSCFIFTYRTTDPFTLQKLHPISF